MDGPTPLLKAELNTLAELAKLVAQEPDALVLKSYFDLCFSEARSLVILEELRQKKAISITKLITDS